MKHRLSDNVKICGGAADRPGIIKPFMVPTQLRHQVTPGAKKTPLTFTPTGKTLVGGTQWRFSTQRPGIAESLIVAKKSTEATVAKVRAGAKGHPKMAAKAVAKAAVAKAKASGISGYTW